MKKYLMLFLLGILIFPYAEAQDTNLSTSNDTTVNTDKKLVYVYDIKEQIAPPVFRKTQKAFEEARELNADLILIHMNTYGGLVDAADSIRTIILNSNIPVYVFIDNNAASAGALISIACDSIYMRPGANIGAATVVTQNAEAAPDKYQSYMRSTMRSTAIEKGRDPLIAEAMVDPDVYVPGVSDSGKVLTFTVDEAIEHDFCEGKVKNIDEILEINGYTNYEIVKQKLTPLDKFIGFMINPFVSGILIMIVIGGIYFELQSPGIGFPLAASVVAALLYFSPLYVEGLAENWEILIFVVGLILVAVEIFAIPGFGVAGISGIIFMVAGLALSMVGNIGFDFSGVPYQEGIKAIVVVVAAMFMAIILSFIVAPKIFTTSAFGHLALDKEQLVEDGYTTAEPTYQEKIGQTGTAYTVLRPAGKALIDGDYYDAVAIAGYIEKGDQIKVVDYINGQLVVEKV